MDVREASAEDLVASARWGRGSRHRTQYQELVALRLIRAEARLAELFLERPIVQPKVPPTAST
ncbi:hypothetical protein ABT255_40165 [Streptomyces mirabilis]|uniref:hypothetical protein n=1 Tax=Streptomyces mirabilis TaxID=68239 RepID=UPI0033235D21